MTPVHDQQAAGRRDHFSPQRISFGLVNYLMAVGASRAECEGGGSNSPCTP